MIRIIHAADLHLDSPFESLDAEKASVRRSEQRALLERIAAEVNQRNADLLFLAGDLLDSGSAYAETGEALLAALGKVRVPVFIAPGNHDWYSRRSPYALLPFPDNVHIFRTPHLESVFLPELSARVWGAGYTSPSCEALLRGFHAPAEEGVTQLLVLHAEPGRAGSPYLGRFTWIGLDGSSSFRCAARFSANRGELTSISDLNTGTRRILPGSPRCS